MHRFSDSEVSRSPFAARGKSGGGIHPFDRQLTLRSFALSLIHLRTGFFPRFSFQ